MLIEDKKAMSAAYMAQVKKFGTPISTELYRELREYALNRKIRISGFRNYVGDIAIIKNVIDDIFEIAVDFPRMLDERLGVILELDYNMKDEDFATTDSGHVIHLNAYYFSCLEKLNESYSEGVKSGDFVNGTDWRAIARHEAGHVVANIYNIDPMLIIMEIFGDRSKTEIFYRLSRELSIYSAAYNDGREVISESFSGYYSRSGNTIADEFVKKCIEIKKGR